MLLLLLAPSWMSYSGGTENCERINTSVFRSREGTIGLEDAGLRRDVFWASPAARTSIVTQETNRRTAGRCLIVPTSIALDYLNTPPGEAKGTGERHISETAIQRNWPPHATIWQHMGFGKEIRFGASRLQANRAQNASIWVQNSSIWQDKHGP